jgi:hypothetical protein
VRNPAGDGVTANNLLSYTDHGLFLTLRVADQESIIQATWIYEHPVDFEGLKRFHDNFGYGITGRLVERSPLPFVRHRWVSVPGPHSEIKMYQPRSRAELTDWVDEQAQLPMDPEWGPGWRISVLPMTDGSTAVSLAGSHVLGDGIAAAVRMVGAVMGDRSDLGYPPPRSRTRRQAVKEDLRQAAHDLPEAARAFVALAKLLKRRRKEPAAPRPTALTALPAAELRKNVVLPGVFVTLEVAEWDSLAKKIGGNGHSLLAAFAAKLAARMGRRGPDGKVAVMIPISARESFDDQRANAVVMATAKLDPDGIEDDLGPARAAMRVAVQKARDEPDDLKELTPLVPWVPKRALRGMADSAFGLSADLPVFCSNVGDLPAEILKIDGTEAEYLFFRGMDRRVTREALERRRGLLTVMAGRVAGRVLMSVVAYHPGWDNTKEALRELVAQTMSDFDLNGRIE